jgi:hypothetical protein
MSIKKCRIFPGIGIARLGNSPDELFIGPEVPDGIASPDGGTFKDSAGRVKRQAARFRIYGYDENDQPVAELTSDGAMIEWEVTQANTKAAFHEFGGVLAEQKAKAAGGSLPLRNADIADSDADPHARDALRITPRPRKISGPSQDGERYRFEDGRFLDHPVALGELRTDDKGRLLVLGGAGRSGSVRPNNPITHYANNDGWYDDTSDGPVTATVTLADGTRLVAEPAWVICAPPDFAPSVGNIVRLLDVMDQVAIEAGWLPRPSVSFVRDVLPILQRATEYLWVNGAALRGHGKGMGNFLDPAILAKLADSSDAAKPLRQSVFARIRKPAGASAAEAVLRFMPALSGDNGDARDGDITTWLTLTSVQYDVLQRWATGDFQPDLANRKPPPSELSEIPLAEQPRALDRAALEHCVGGAFFPGIEMTYISRYRELYAGLYRLRPTLRAGDISQYMALPWQADFYECRDHWWPAQRPDDVLTEDAFDDLVAQAALPPEAVDLAVLASSRERWDRGIGEQVGYSGPPRYAGDNDMVDKWHQLGFLVARPGPDGQTYVIETERGVVDPYASLTERDYFYYLMNIDAHSDFIPKARALARSYLAQVPAIEADPQTSPLERFFPYTEADFDQRLNDIYQALVDYVESYDPAQDKLFTSRTAVIERIRQLAPFNQTDGAWLHTISRVGPIDEVISQLFAIWADEIGSGDVALNHANLYTDLMHQVGIYTPDIASREYASDPRFVNSAFTVPVFQLAISQFSQEFLPEILGMTLQLEWEVIGIKRTMKLLDHWGIDTHFYEMHVGIDNASTGHGAKARAAIQLFLDQAFQRGGDELRQRLWRRIWTGRVAFGNLGNVSAELTSLIQSMDTPDGLRSRVVALVRRKAQYASQNHNDKKLAGVPLNHWFKDPEGLVDELARSTWIIPGDPEHSPFFNKLDYDGPMYKVFTPDETELLKAWIRAMGKTAPAPVTAPDLAMATVIDRMRSVQTGTPGHDANQLTGPDPSDPSKKLTASLAAWFRQPTAHFMKALADPANELITPGNPGTSRFVQIYLNLSTGGAMAAALASTFTEIAPKSAGQIIVDWIAAGCPIPALASGQQRWLGPGALAGHGRPHWRIRGMGEVH